MTWRSTRGRIRRILRVLIPVVMLGLGVVTVWFGGWAGLLALAPILAIHVLVAAVLIPLWLRFRRRSSSEGIPEQG
ncbi:MAG: hypothetical protein ACE5EF_07600 [Dehalococcoidia bacterium]